MWCGDLASEMQLRRLHVLVRAAAVSQKDFHSRHGVLKKIALSLHGVEKIAPT